MAAISVTDLRGSRSTNTISGAHLKWRPKPEKTSWTASWIIQSKASGVCQCHFSDGCSNEGAGLDGHFMGMKPLMTLSGHL